MTIEVGDKVRLTREAILKHPDKLNRSLVLGGELLRFDEGFVKISGSTTKFQMYNLELVPEKPEFEYGEEIEVSDNGKTWEKVIFLTKIPGNIEYPYICVASSDKGIFNQGKIISPCEWRYARKPKSTLSREEIAEKFGIDKDFILTD